MIIFLIFLSRRTKISYGIVPDFSAIFSMLFSACFRVEINVISSHFFKDSSAKKHDKFIQIFPICEKIFSLWEYTSFPLKFRENPSKYPKPTVAIISFFSALQVCE